MRTFAYILSILTMPALAQGQTTPIHEYLLMLIGEPAGAAIAGGLAVWCVSNLRKFGEFINILRGIQPPRKKIPQDAVTAEIQKLGEDIREELKAHDGKNNTDFKKVHDDFTKMERSMSEGLNGIRDDVQKIGREVSYLKGKLEGDK